MKTTILSFLAAFFLGVANVHASDDKEVKIKTSAICEMCKERIERNLGLSKGVKESNLNLKDKVVTVKYNPNKTTPEAIKATIINTGYDADEQLASQKAHDRLPDCCRKTATPGLMKK
ncbi:heavy-metal-associated domain-containing protein [Dyadobacter arcticus]|uniref:Copper chaperone CopZ n=1 Tax=Dyadobacter arcticus TaxID=1078754 RepID=A0ABX0UVC0_9BACT|nr:heavy metal-associated domain-containing protein [Dyadobacter arcticus]NIJ55770.1 copper chaperone CopZ [Dyadobacter arcticus]